VRNRNEDAAVTQNEQGTKHCGPVVSGLLVMVGRSRSRQVTSILPVETSPYFLSLDNNVEGSFPKSIILKGTTVKQIVPWALDYK